MTASIRSPWTSEPIRNSLSQKKWEWFNDKTGERSADVSYKYLRAEPVTIGDCTFTADFGEQTYTDPKTGNSGGKIFLWHFPDLRLTVGNPSPDVTFQGISTTFEPIEFAEPNWSPTPSKTDDH